MGREKQGSPLVTATSLVVLLCTSTCPAQADWSGDELVHVALFAGPLRLIT